MGALTVQLDNTQMSILKIKNIIKNRGLYISIILNATLGTFIGKSKQILKIVTYQTKLCICTSEDKVIVVSLKWCASLYIIYWIFCKLILNQKHTQTLGRSMEIKTKVVWFLMNYSGSKKKK